MKRRAPSNLGPDELLCPKHRQPIKGFCVDKHCTQKSRYICSLCKDLHKYDTTEYFDEVMNWDYISKHKFKKMIDTLEERKTKRTHKVVEMEKSFGRIFENLTNSLVSLVEAKKKEFLTRIEKEIVTSSKEEYWFLQRVLRLRKSVQKVIKNFNRENFLRESLEPFLDKYHDVKSLETKFLEIQKLPLVSLQQFSGDCLTVQQSLQTEIPKCVDQFFRKEDLRKVERVLFSFPKFTIDEEHIKVSTLQYYLNDKEETDTKEFDLLSLSEGSMNNEDGEPTFEKLNLLHFDDSGEYLFTQSSSKRFVVLNGLESKSKYFSYQINELVSCNFLSKDHQQFYFGTEKGELYLFNVKTQNIQKLYELLGSKLIGITVTNDPNCLAVASGKMLFFFDFTKDPCLFEAYDLIYTLSCITFLSSLNLFVLGFANGKLSCWSPRNKAEMSQKMIANDGIKKIIASEDERTLFTCSEEGHICYWKIVNSTLSLLRLIKITSPLLSPDLFPFYSYNLLIVKEDWLLKIFRLDTGKLLKRMHIRVYQDFKILYDKKKAILNLYKSDG